MTTYIEGVAVPPNDGDLPLEFVYDYNPVTRQIGAVKAIRIAWQGYTIREQFPWTKPHAAATKIAAVIPVSAQLGALADDARHEAEQELATLWGTVQAAFEAEER